MNRQRLQAAIKEAEGFSDHSYWDVIHPTGGYGHALPADWDVDSEITRAMADGWLEQDVQAAIADTLKLFPQLETFADARQEALVEMCYNIGLPRLKGFVKMLNAVNEEDWPEAALQATDSQWYRQTGRRAMRIIHMIESGEVARPKR